VIEKNIIMPNLNTSFNALFVGGGAEKERRSNGTKHTGRGGNELIEDWPCRGKMSSKKPPSSINVLEPHYSVPLRDKTGRRLRRNSTVSTTIEDHDESSCAATNDTTLFNSLNSAAVDSFSCYSLNDISLSDSSDGIATRRNSVNTAPDLSHGGSRRVRPSRARASSTSGSIASRTSRKKKKRVRFTEEAPSLYRYVPVAPNTHYSSEDDDYFRQYTLTLARGVVRLLKTDAVHDESFDVLTGLPSAHCLRRYLNHPDIAAEEVVGMEDLLAGPGIASARKRLKNVQVKKVLAEQRRQRQLGMHDPTIIAKSLRKTSSISSNIARCRAAYAAGIAD